MKAKNDPAAWEHINTVTRIAEETYTQAQKRLFDRDIHLPRYLRKRWHQLPDDFRILLITVAATALREGYDLATNGSRKPKRGTPGHLKKEEK